MSSFVATSSKIGVNLNAATSSALFGLGDIVQGSNGTEWIYAYISGGAPSGGGMTLAPSGTTACMWTPTFVATGRKMAFAQYAVTDGQYAWLATRGNPINVYVSSTSTLLATLYPSATSGAMSTTDASGTLQGVMLLTASTTTIGGTYLATVTWPIRVNVGGA